MVRRLRGFAGLATLTGLLITGVVNAPVASAAGTGSISGTVLYAAAGVSGVCVTAKGATTASVITGTTGAAGTYTLTGMTPDNYTVYFDPSCAGSVSSPYAWQYYNGVTPKGSATAVPVESGPVALSSTNLTMGSTISGTVLAGGSPVGGVCVEFVLTTAPGEIAQAVSAAGTGTYSLGSFPDANYELRFDPTCFGTQSSPYAIQVFNGQSDWSTSTVIEIVAPDSAATGINAALIPGASISGTVTATGATSPANVCVEAYAGTNGYYEALANANAAGDYDITNLPGDSYKLEFDPSCLGAATSDFGPTWYNGATNFSGGTSFSLSSGGTLTGINGSVALDLPAVAISTASIPAGSTTSAYSATVQAGGGTGPYSWATTGLPAGLTIAPTTGVISGTPTAGGTFTVAVTATDSSEQPVSATGSYSLVITQPAVVTTTTVPAQRETVCTDKTKTEMIRTIEVKNGKKIVIITHKKVRVYKTVTTRKTETIKGIKVLVITHKTELVKVCKTVIVG
jgi:hypothetical protein